MRIRPHIDEYRKTIIAEVFSATGRKIDPDDPIVASALIQAAFMATASDLAALRIQAAADRFADRATRFEAAIKAADFGGDQLKLAQSLGGIVADLGTLPGRLDMLVCSIVGAFLGGSLIVGVLLLMNLLS